MANPTSANKVIEFNAIEVEGHRFELRNRSLAALFAWLVPGAGHFYQGRKRKAAIFFIAILTTYFIGFAIGGGHVVYASWAPGDKRWNYFCQVGVGVAALPALIQTNRLRGYTDERTGHTEAGYEPLWGGFMAPPRRPVLEDNPDDIAAWYARWGAGYEMGTWYTMIAGLLNILAIYDAFSGPLSTPISGRRRASKDEEADETAEAEPGEATDRAAATAASSRSEAGADAEASEKR